MPYCWVLRSILQFAFHPWDDQAHSKGNYQGFGIAIENIPEPGTIKNTTLFFRRKEFIMEGLWASLWKMILFCLCAVLRVRMQLAVENIQVEIEPGETGEQSLHRK